MAESSDRRTARRAAQADLEVALRTHVEAHMTPILAEVMTALRASGLPEGQLLWRAIGILETALDTIQQRAHAASQAETE